MLGPPLQEEMWDEPQATNYTLKGGLDPKFAERKIVLGPSYLENFGYDSTTTTVYREAIAYEKLGNLEF